MNIIGPLSLHAMEKRGWIPDSVGGLTLGADPVAFAISYASAARTRTLRAFTVRKEPKTHGMGNLIEGPFRSDDRVVVIEDVITTGKSALQAIDVIGRTGAQILGVLAVVNRDEGGIEAISARGFETLALTSIHDLAS